MLPREGEPPLPEGAEVPTMIDIKVELLCPQHNPVCPSPAPMNFFVIWRIIWLTSFPGGEGKTGTEKSRDI